MGLMKAHVNYSSISNDFLPPGLPRQPAGLPRGRSLEIVKFKQLDGAPAPSSCLNLTISSSLKPQGPREPRESLGALRAT